MLNDSHSGTCLITGSTSGIGKATAVQIARQGWRVIVHGRKEPACAGTRNEIIEASGNTNVDFITGDLSLMADVERMAKEIITRFPDLNVLVNNAGTFSVDRIVTKEGIEFTWAVNYLSRFLLVYRLLDLLNKNAPSRIVDVAGAYHSKGQINFDDINLAVDYSWSAANNQSKLANVLFTYKLADKLNGKDITANCLHPGNVNTGSVLRAPGIPFYMKIMYRMMSVFAVSPEEGAATSVYLATSPEVAGVSGKYFIDKKETESAPQTYDRELKDKLWEFSENELKRLR